MSRNKRKIAILLGVVLAVALFTFCFLAGGQSKEDTPMFEISYSQQVQ